MKLSTINLIVESILEQGGDKAKVVANEATIYLKTALICEQAGIDEAIKYFTGTHSEDEYKEWQTSIVAPREMEKK